MIAHTKHDIFVPCDHTLHFKGPATPPLGACGFSSLGSLLVSFHPEAFFEAKHGFIVIPESVSPEADTGLGNA